MQTTFFFKPFLCPVFFPYHTDDPMEIFTVAEVARHNKPNDLWVSCLQVELILMLGQHWIHLRNSNELQETSVATVGRYACRVFLANWGDFGQQGGTCHAHLSALYSCLLSMYLWLCDIVEKTWWFGFSMGMVDPLFRQRIGNEQLAMVARCMISPIGTFCILVGRRCCWNMAAEMRLKQAPWPSSDWRRRKEGGVLVPNEDWDHVIATGRKIVKL